MTGVDGAYESQGDANDRIDAALPQDIEQSAAESWPVERLVDHDPGLA
jgi:hypothetical protein